VFGCVHSAFLETIIYSLTMAAQQAQGGGAPVMWKHIGLHAHSVGTFVCEEKRVVWKSAITGRDDDGASPGTTRIVPANKLKNAYWTVFGKSGHLRLQTTGGTETSPLAHELRFDGFPEKDFDILKDVLKRSYNLDLQTLNMSSAGTQYGLTAVGNKKLIFRHCVLDEMNEEGQAFEPRAENEMLSLDLAEVSQVSISLLDRCTIAPLMFCYVTHSSLLTYSLYVYSLSLLSVRPTG
jgi:POB3-like N-terminal PH domain